MPGVGYRFIAQVRETYPADEVRAVTDAIQGLGQEEQTSILRAAAARLGLSQASSNTPDLRGAARSKRGT